MYAEPHTACQQQVLGSPITKDKTEALTFCNSCLWSHLVQVALQLHRTSIESQDGLGWKEPLKVIQPNSPAIGRDIFY